MGARHPRDSQYGVDLKKITWVLSGDEHVAEYKAPGNVVPIEPGKKMAEMLASGELVAAIGVEVEAFPDVVPLIPNAAEAGLEALRTRGHYPINHLVVMKDELLAAHPELARTSSTRSPSRSSSTWTKLEGRKDREADRHRQDAPARHGDHRQGPAAVRHRAQPQGARGAGQPRDRAGDHHQARLRSRNCSRRAFENGRRLIVAELPRLNGVIRALEAGQVAFAAFAQAADPEPRS